MRKQSKVCLRERAAVAWQEECAQRASWADELRQEIRELFGSNHHVEIDLNAGKRPVALVEGMRFILSKECENGVEMFTYLMLLSNCSRCGRDTGVDINSLADLGRWLAVLEKNPGEYCSKCIGLPKGVEKNINQEKPSMNHLTFVQMRL
jgi:hypothetical protein